MRTLAFALSAATLLSGAALAHDAYVTAEPGGAYLIAWGHPGEAPGRYDVEEVTEAALYGADGERLEVRRAAVDGQVRLMAPDGADVAMATFLFEPGDTIQTGEGRYTQGSKADHPGYRRAFHSVRSGKALYAWTPAFADPLGSELELVPLSDPFAEANEVELVLLHDGEPLPGADVTFTTGGEERDLTTGADGTLSVTLPESGAAMVAARHSIPIDSETVDERALATVLSIQR